LQCKFCTLQTACCKLNKSTENKIVLLFIKCITLFINHLTNLDMSLTLTFKPVGFTTAKYFETLKQLEAAGAGAPKGRNYHVCYGDPESITVTDVWDSEEDFQVFGATLMPIMQSLGVDPGQPDVQQVHNIIIG
jgi:hypothetical protein